MKRNLWVGVAILWLVPLVVALRYWQVWDRLPASVAVHFVAANQPNGWTTRAGSLAFIVCALGIIALVATLIIAFLRRGVVAWATLGFLYVMAGVFFWANEQILSYNLYRRPVQIAPIVGLVLLATVGIAAVYLGTNRGSDLAHTHVIADEVHAWRGLGLAIMILPLALMLAIVASVPNNNLRVALGSAAVILLGALVMAWSGFHYRFTNAGLEIRTLGFRLRSIPAAQIEQYAPGTWTLIGGYGIRGVGDCRAYVWGNRGVRIKTTQGDVFLGHSNPQQLIHDLDLVTHSTHS
jgi:Domain of unknown function (DUF1648)